RPIVALFLESQVDQQGSDLRVRLVRQLDDARNLGAHQADCRRRAAAPREATGTPRARCSRVARPGRTAPAQGNRALTAGIPRSVAPLGWEMAQAANGCLS